MRLFHLHRDLLIIVLALATLNPRNARGQDQPKFRDADLPLTVRVDDLISRLTLDEKVSQMMMSCAAIPRLNIPAYHWWSEALHGVARNGAATVFPQAIGMAATWNPDLHHQMAAVISTEARAKYAQTIRASGGETKIYQGLTLWSPNINIFRDPRWGRGQETYGEDPFLTAQFGVAFVRGLQGDDPRYLKTVATVKHFAVHSGPESLRHKFDATISARDLRETYLPAFEAAIRQGHAHSLMSAYNAINGIPAPANSFLLTDVLRKEWGFDGAVVGDVDTVSDMWMPGGHGYAKDAAEASAMAVKAGNDLCSGTTYRALPQAIQRGLITEADLDASLRRLFNLRFRLGLFDAPDRVPYAQIPESDNDTQAHDQLALEAARQSLVLLKNDGTLPWNPKDLKTVAVLGPTADDALTVLGNYYGTPTHPSTVLKGLKSKLEPMGVKVVYDAAIPLVAGFNDAGRPLPEGVIFTDASQSTPGLKRDLFGEGNFAGTPQSSRTDIQVNLLWNEAQPTPGIPARDAHLRWTGVLIPKKTADYALGITFVGAAQLFVDDALAVGETRFRPAGEVRTRSVKRTLEAGHAYRIRIEFNQNPGDAMGRIEFGWRAPGSMDDAIVAARDADHIVLGLGIDSSLEGEEMRVNAEGFAGGDRKSILLPQIQRDLIDAVAKLGKPFIVVLSNGSALSFDVTKPNAILEAWYFGQRGGDAVADAIVGQTNPGGRLPVTFYQSEADLPAFDNYAMAGRTYRYFTKKPLFAFGFGLSYTTFAYEKVDLSSSIIRPGQTIRVSTTVQNTGKYDGDEVVQIYATAVSPPVSMPLRQLIGFQRVALKVGETRTVNIDVPAETLQRWDEAQNRYVVDPGKYVLRVGPSSDQPALETALTAEQ